MLLRRFFPTAAVAVALACAPSIKQEQPPARVTYAVFDPLQSLIPLPNDLALLPTTIAAFPDGAQKDLLTSFYNNGGFPNDQETAITIDFQTQVIDPATGAITTAVPDLDVTTISNSTLRIIKLPGTPVEYAAVTAANYVKGTERGTLTLHNMGGLPWDAGGIYVVAVRGGANGVKVVGGDTINPPAAFFLLTRGVNLAMPENQSLLKLQCNPSLPTSCSEQAAAQGEQLEGLRKMYLTPFAAVDSFFDSKELAVLSTFHINPSTVPHVETDPGRGLMPLPSDFLLDDAGKLVQKVPAFGPLADGIATLDGFSTTGMVISFLSAPVDARTITANNVFLYDMSNPLAPVRVKDLTEGGVYVTEPPQITQTISVGGVSVPVSTAIGLQPAIPVANQSNPLAPYTLPPFKENTEYVVLISNGVKDATNPTQGLVRSTLGNLMLLAPEHPLAAGGKSLLPGVISDAQATGLEKMRQLLHLAIARLAIDKPTVTRNQLVMGYSFRTQSVSGAGNLADKIAGKAAADQRPAGLIQLAGLPYLVEQTANAASQFVFVPNATFASYTRADAWKKFGLDARTPNADIAEVIAGSTFTFNLLSNATGAFDPAKLAAATPSLEPIKFLLAVPTYAATPACPSGYPVPAGAHCAPLVIFHHGLGGSKSAMLTVANEYAKKGFLVAAIDSAKHGDRAWCSADAQCNTGGTCVKITGSETQHDAVPPGICSSGNLKAPTKCSTKQCVLDWMAWTAASSTDPADGLARNSANYLVTPNFFRVRDTFRQDVIDQSALILALARPPTVQGFIDIPTANQALRNHLGAGGIVIDPAKIHWVGQSLGAMLGTLNLAANPRLSAGVLNAGGATITDILTNAPYFKPGICTMLNGLTPPLTGPYSASNPSGCDILDTAGYLKFLLVAKWVLDPAEPINFAGHLLGGTAWPTLPNVLATTAVVPQSPKTVLGQAAACDTTIPNAFNFNLFGNIGLGPKSLTTSTASLFMNPAAATTACPLGAVPDGFLTDRGISITGYDSNNLPNFALDDNIASLTLQAQDHGAAFLVNSSTLPPPQVTP